MTQLRGAEQLRYIVCPSVDEQTLRGVFLNDLAWDFNTVAHISVTQELTFELQIAGVRRALPLGAILDALEFSLMRGHELSPDLFPGPPEEELSSVAVPFPNWLDELMAWYDKLNGLEISLNIHVREVIYDFLQNETAGSAEFRDVFDSGGAIAKAIRQLVEIGLRPENIIPKSLEGQVALRAWQEVSARLPDSQVLLDYLFIDHRDPQNADDSRHAIDRLESLIRKAFGFSADEKIRIAYHGLYFYSPLQWALFELLAEMGVEQVFLVHDDNVGPQFEIWRRFFFECAHLKPLPNTTVSERTVDGRAEFLSRVLVGGQPNMPSNLNFFSFQTVTDLARHVRRFNSQRSAEERVQRQVFAAAASDVNRRIARFERLSGEHDDRKLLHLPIGRFLLGLQECIRVRADQVESGLDFATMSHLIEGGYLNSESASSDRPLTEVLSLCEVFFSGCRSLDQWSARLSDLEVFYEPQSHGFAGILKLRTGDRFALRNPSQRDSTYLIDAVRNHLRRAPWLDLSKTEWQALSGSIRRIVKAVEQLTRDDMVKTRERIEELVELVRTSTVAPSVYGASEWSMVLEALGRLPAAPDLQVQIARISEILPVILGKQLDHGRTEIRGSKVAAGLVYSLAAPLRGLEACGFSRKRQIHLTNLSDAVFPYKPKLFGWPFHRDEVALASGDDATAWRIRIVDELDRSGGLGDLYLLWLALNGSNGDVTLSWLSEVAGEKLNPSPLLALLLEVEKARPSVRAFAGGAVMKKGPAMSRVGEAETEVSIVAIGMPDLVERNAFFQPITLADGLPASKALASAEICARRTALQWMLRPFASFRSVWQLGILYGNLLGLPQKEVISGKSATWVSDWKRLLDRLWSWMSDAERERAAMRSSVNRRNDEHGTASPEWLLTLEGAHDRDDRLSDAYRRATQKGGRGVRAKVEPLLFGSPGEILPKPNTNGLEVDDLFGDTRNQMWYLCDRCPVSDRCLERRYRPE